MTPERMAAIHKAAFTSQRPWTEREFADLLNSSNNFSVEVDDHTFAIGQAVAGEAELLTIATHPDFQRQGFGCKCLKIFVERVRSLEADTIFLEVDEGNTAAIALYTSAGFNSAGRRRAYYKHANGERSDAILMIFSTKWSI